MNPAAEPRVTLREMLDMQGAGAHATLLVMLAAPCMLSLPGITTLLCVGLASVGVALWNGQSSCALPSRVQSLALARPTAERIVRMSGRLHAWALAVGRPRWMAATRLGRRSWAATLVWSMALLIWLPVPFGNILPALAVALLGLALAARDGMMAMGAVVLALLSVATTLAMGWGVLAWLPDAWRLISG